MSSRLLGAVIGFSLGLCAMLVPIGVESWFPGVTGYPIPPAVGAVTGGAIAGAVLARRAAATPRRRLGLLACGFAGLAALSAAPVFAIDGALWSVLVPPDPGDELFHAGPLMSAAFDVFFLGAVALLLAIPQGIVWVLLMTRAAKGRSPDLVTSPRAD